MDFLLNQKNDREKVVSFLSRAKTQKVSQHVNDVTFDSIIFGFSKNKIQDTDAFLQKQK